jgi:DNA-binding NtrC family response regulator
MYAEDHVPKDFLPKNKQCECELCVYSREVREKIERRDVNELIKVIEDLMNANYNVGFDLDYYKCIMDGSWPSAVEQLEAALERAKNHPNRKLEKDGF